MSKEGAAVKAARGWHKFGLAISATALLLLVAPEKIDFSAALREANTIRNLKMDDYKVFVSGFIGQNTLLPTSSGVAHADWELGITRFLNSEMNQTVVDGDFPNPTWSIAEIIDYVRPPNDGTLVDWLRWIDSTEPANYYHPDWETARLSMSRDHTGNPLVRHFSVKPSRYHRSPGEYSFRAYLDARVTSNDQSEYISERAKRTDWWSELEASDFRELETLSIRLGPDRWIVEGDVDSTRKSVRGRTGINHWLRQRGTWSALSKTNNLGEEVIPGIREHWKQLEGMTLTGAIAFMEGAQMEISTLNLLGLQIPGELCVVAIPLAYLFVYLFLFLEIRFLRAVLRSNVDTHKSDPQWMGLYDDALAVWTTAVSIAVVPISLSLGLLLKYYPFVELPVLAAGGGFLALAAIVQTLILRATGGARRIMAESSPEE